MRDIGVLLLAVTTATGYGMQGGSESDDVHSLVRSSDERLQEPKVTP